jgi:hypothetical protein
MLPPTLDSTAATNNSNTVLQPAQTQMCMHNSANYLYKYLCECPDMYARRTAVHVFTACMKALAVHGGLPTAAENTSASSESYQLLWALLGTVVNMLQEIPLYGRQYEELFLLIKELALANNFIRELLVHMNVGVAVSMFISKHSTNKENSGGLFPRIYQAVSTSIYIYTYMYCVLLYSIVCIID